MTPLLAAATAQLAAAGVGSPRVDAELLLAHVLGVPRSRLLTIDAVDEPSAARFAELVARRAAREPLQHLTGHVPFRHLELAVGPGVFVPRPETELLVDAVLAATGPAPVVVDLCSGSGAIALAIAQERPGATVYAVEVSPDALPWLRRNADGTGVTVLAADVRRPIDALPAGVADAVVSNPPYVPDGTPVDPEVRADPAAAVFGGPDGLALMPAILDRAAELLADGGVLAVEHDDTHGTSLPALLESDGRFSAIADHPDLTGRPRYATARRVTARRAATTHTGD